MLDIPAEDAEDFVCKMEHAIPDHVLERFVAFAEFVARCPNRGATWEKDARGYFCDAHGSGQTLCDSCRLKS